MILAQKTQFISFHKGNTQFDFLPTGDIYQILDGDFLVNQYVGNCMDGSMNNIYMRIYEKDSIKVVPLLGIRSGSSFEYNNRKTIFKGQWEGIGYSVTFTLARGGIWFWQIDAEGSKKTIDFIYGQDLSLGVKGGTLTNELYISQYLGHSVLNSEHGYVIASRQNQSQKDLNPYIQTGSMDTKIVGYSTDAMQFFGKSYKKNYVPENLTCDLPNINYQFEMSYIGLQTEKIELEGSHRVTFYNLFKENHPKAVTRLEYKSILERAYKAAQSLKGNGFKKEEPISLKSEFGAPFVSETMTDEELQSYFPQRELEEYDGDKLLSFFAPGHRHVVLMEKELKSERPHGNIVTTAINVEHLSKQLITSTSYMYGVFNSQVTVGNTSFHKLLSTTRGLLNFFKNSGQRIFLKLGETFHLLTMPAVYELGVNFSRWYYKTDKDMIVVTAYSAADRSDVVLELSSKNNTKYEYIITNQLVMGNHEFEEKIVVERENNKIRITPSRDNNICKEYPLLNYFIKINGAEFTLSDDRIFFEGEKAFNQTLMTLKLDKTEKFQLAIEGHLEEAADTDIKYNLDDEIKKYNKLYDELTCGFTLSLPDRQDRDLKKLNEIMWWYTHNAMVHFAVPHGLEQPGGAAWGTRDVCQGPLEFFMATEHYGLAREVIVEIYNHQFLESGEWPQWFMFDRYRLQQFDCHGDVVFWPLKVIGDYIRITGDYSILDSRAGYRHCETGEISEEKENILVHTKRAIDNIKTRYVYNTNLINYAGGDWDDTLQPANMSLRDNLVSAWTVSLAYQVINQLGQVLESHDKQFSSELLNMAANLKAAFDKYLVKNGVLAGFAYFDEEEKVEYLLHPDDRKTGIHYRLIPMTRCIIAELAEKEQAEKNVEVIHEKLLFQDGVRLMDKPARYRGGVSKIFLRAEQAANVGREISLQYTHAHIRYIEALAKLGKAENAWDALFTINPINIKEKVPNAAVRQSNTYFSSSDGMFNNRYEYAENFDKLKTGEVDVKGGWRIYSSGPGIYINQLISNLLGLRFNESAMIIDPVIPVKYDNLRFEYMIDKKNITFVYHVKVSGKKIEKVLIDGKEVAITHNSNPYRNGGCMVAKEILKKELKDYSIIDIF